MRRCAPSSPTLRDHAHPAICSATPLPLRGRNPFQVAPPINIYRNPVSRFVANLVGDTNVLTILSVDGDRAKTQGGNWLPLPPKTAPAAKYLAIRPESLRLSKPDAPNNVAPVGNVEAVESAGVLTKLSVRCLDDVLLTTAANNNTPLGAGDPCTMTPPWPEFNAL